MSKIKFRSFPQSTANYTKTAAPESSATVCPVSQMSGLATVNLQTGIPSQVIGL